ncbi:MAG: hypothetical protein PHD76_06680 [Methylacidiphilales bacterium]|nr:hypothetical protein [Candidatus Methylacidiphilales bacterium]
MRVIHYFSILFLSTMLAGKAWCCACGCDVLEMGNVSMFPSGAGGLLYVDYAYQNQNTDYSGDSRAPAENNNDKKIQTQFITLGLQYMFSASWGIRAEIPHAFRNFSTTGGAGGSDPVSVNWNDIGDLRIEGIYSGFAPDMSTGITFGFKLPSGDYSHNDAYGDVDRDTQIGTGSTDLLFGAYHVQRLTSDNLWSCFMQAHLDLPVLEQEGYWPGTEIDTATGIQYNGLAIGKLKIKPLAQIIGSYRTSDSGPNAANPVASGFERVLLSPGLEFDLHPVMLHAAAEFTAYDYVRGSQLVAPVFFKLGLSVAF